MVIAGLLVLGLVAWLVAVRAMGGMTMGGRYELGAPIAFLGVWVLMMAAMMFPSVWPAMVVHERLLESRAKRGRVEPGRGAAFISGYLLSWTAYGVVAFVVVAIVRDSLSGVSDADVARYVVAPIAIARRGVSGGAAETLVPAPLPHADVLDGRALARGDSWLCLDGCGARRVLCWLLLAFDGVDGRGRCDERGVDGVDRACDRAGEALADSSVGRVECDCRGFFDGCGGCDS